MALSSDQRAEVEGWLALYAANSAAFDAQVVAAVQQAYAEVGDWFNPAITLATASAVTATVRASLDTQSGLATQFIAGVLEALGAASLSARAPRLDYPRTVDPFEVYSRPVFKVRDALDAGMDEATAILNAQELAAVLAETDALLARRDAATQAFVMAGEVSGYRRVIRPELSTTGVCGLCIAAARQVYKLDELMPIHSRCKCTVLPVVEGKDPATEFNVEDLANLYADIPGTKRDDLARTRFRVRRDGELGPLLTPSDRRGVPRLTPAA